jgi:hypothetical protein
MRRSLLAAALLLAGCTQAPPRPLLAPQVTTDPDPVTASVLTKMSRQQEAAVLAGIAPALPSLVRRTWGVPAGVPWRLEVMMTPWRVNDHGRLDFWIDTSSAPSPRDRVRQDFRRALEDSLTPPAPSRAWYVGDMRGVSVQGARAHGDSVLVLVDVSAGMRCADGRNVMHAVGYEIALVRQAKGKLALADRAPVWMGESGKATGQAVPASCAPKLLIAAQDD